jgi:hypothetical protein
MLKLQTPNSKFQALRKSQIPSLENPKGIPAQSPSLRGTSNLGKPLPAIIHNPNGVEAASLVSHPWAGSRNPVGVDAFSGHSPGVSRCSQPRAARRNPFGIEAAYKEQMFRHVLGCGSPLPLSPPEAPTREPFRYTHFRVIC